MDDCIKMCQCLSPFLVVSVLACIPPIEIVADKYKMVYSAAHSPVSGKALWVKCDQRRVTFCKWEERLSGSSTGEWTQPRDMVTEKPWTGEFLPNLGNVQQ